MSVCASSNVNFTMDTKFMASFLVKERHRDWENEVHKNESNRGRNLHFFGDRFIPNRFNREAIERNLKYFEKTQKDTLKMKLTPNYWRQSSFISEINHIFDVKERRVLQFNNNVLLPLERRNRAHIEKDWPCMPRSRPWAFQYAAHDLPEFEIAFDYNLMDWSVKNQIAISFGQDVVIWRDNDDTTMLFSVKHPKCLKYSPDGKHLAIGCMDCQYPVLELWKLQSNRQFLVAGGKCFHKGIQFISCIEWTKNGSEIVCGTAKGVILVLYFPSLNLRLQINEHKHQVNNIRFSPTMRYLATGDINGNICIFDQSYRFLIYLCSLRCSIMFDWHPWADAELAVSRKMPASILIFNIPRREIVAVYQRKDKRIRINSITFSKLTGELLVSIVRRDDEGCPNCEILVLASLTRVVDILSNEDRGGSLFMMWSSDGTKIATGDLDNSFSLWNFYPTHKVDALVKRRAGKATLRTTMLNSGGILR